MVTYSVEAILAILSPMPAIEGHPLFKGLWDIHRTLVTQLHNIKHPNHPCQGMAGGMISPEAFVLVPTIPWESLERMGEFFAVLRDAITDTYQRTAEW